MYVFYYIEIHESAGAYTLTDMDTSFVVEMPTRDQYEAYDFAGILKGFKDTGNTNRMAMMLQVIYCNLICLL